MRFTLILKNCIRRGKEWRDASTLILARQKEVSEKDAVEFLMVERSKGSSFLPGGLCYPGIEKSSLQIANHCVKINPLTMRMFI